MLLVALLVAAMSLTAAAGACGGAAAPATSASASPAVSDRPQPAPEPSEVVPAIAPLLRIGQSASFLTSEKRIVRVVADAFFDPADADTGLHAGADERPVSVSVSVDVEPLESDTTGLPVALPFKKASFLLLAADDTIYTPAAWDAPSPVGARAKPGVARHYEIAFVLPSVTRPVRFVCTPLEGSTPRSATWILRD
jgi:hypothetical protein